MIQCWTLKWSRMTPSILFYPGYFSNAWLLLHNVCVQQRRKVSQLMLMPSCDQCDLELPVSSATFHISWINRSPGREWVEGGEPHSHSDSVVGTIYKIHALQKESPLNVSAGGVCVSMCFLSCDCWPFGCTHPICVKAFLPHFNIVVLVFYFRWRLIILSERSGHSLAAINVKVIQPQTQQG